MCPVIRSLVLLVVLSFCAWAAHADPKEKGDGWYTVNNFDDAVKEARKLGRPLAILYATTNSTCPLANKKVAEWERMPGLSDFVRVRLFTADNLPDVFKSIRKGAVGKEGKYLPMLFIGRHDGEFLNLVKYEHNVAQGAEELNKAQKQFGETFSKEKMNTMWKKLEKAREAWTSGEHDKAMKEYCSLKKNAKDNRKLGIFEEVDADEPKIVKKAVADMEEVDALLDKGDATGAKARLTTLQKTYDEFDFPFMNLQYATLSKEARTASLSKAVGEAECRNRWFAHNEFADVLRYAAELQKPVMVIYYRPDLSKDSFATIDSWKALEETDGYICAMVDCCDKLPDVMRKLVDDGKDREGQFVPRIYLAAPDGSFKDVIKCGTAIGDVAKALQAGLK